MDAALVVLGDGLSLIKQRAISVKLTTESGGIISENWDVRQDFLKLLKISKDDFILEQFSMNAKKDSISTVFVLNDKNMIKFDEVTARIPADGSVVRLGKAKYVIRRTVGCPAATESHLDDDDDDEVNRDRSRSQSLRRSTRHKTFSVVSSGSERAAASAAGEVSNRGIWLRNLPQKWFQLSSEGSLIDSKHILRQALESKYGPIEAMDAVVSEKELAKDVCILFRSSDSDRAFSLDFSSPLHSVIATKEQLKTTFIISVERDESGYFSPETIQQRRELVQRQTEKRQKLEHELKRSSKSIVYAENSMQDLRGRESIHKELDKPDIASLWHQLSAVIDSLQQEGATSRSYLDDDGVSHDYKRMAISTHFLYTRGQELSEGISALKAKVADFIAAREQEEQELADKQRLENLQIVVTTATFLLDQGKMLSQNIDAILKSEVWESVLPCDVQELQLSASLHQFNSMLTSLEKMLEQRREGSQRYIDILNNALNMNQERLDVLLPYYHALNALKLFQEFMNKTKSDIDDYSRRAVNASKGLASSVETAETVTVSALQGFYRQGQQYITSTLRRLTNEAPATAVAKAENSLSKQQSQAPLIDDRDVFQLADTINALLAILKDIFLLVDHETRNAEEIAAASSNSTSADGVRSLSQRLRAELEKELKSRRSRYEEQFEWPHQGRRQQLTSLMLQLKSVSSDFVDSNRVDSDDGADSVTTAAALEQGRSLLSTTLMLLQREGARYVADVRAILDKIVAKNVVEESRAFEDARASAAAAAVAATAVSSVAAVSETEAAMKKRKERFSMHPSAESASAVSTTDEVSNVLPAEDKENLYSPSASSRYSNAQLLAPVWRLFEDKDTFGTDIPTKKARVKSIYTVSMPAVRRNVDPVASAEDKRIGDAAARRRTIAQESREPGRIRVQVKLSNDRNDDDVVAAIASVGKALSSTDAGSDAVTLVKGNDRRRDVSRSVSRSVRSASRTRSRSRATSKPRGDVATILAEQHHRRHRVDTTIILRDNRHHQQDATAIVNISSTTEEEQRLKEVLLSRKRQRQLSARR